MKKFNKLVMAFTIMTVLGAGSAVYAATAMNPAEITSGLTGKSVEALNQERTAGKTYGAIANEAGKGEEFKSQMLEQKKIILDQRVADKKLTQEQADSIYNSIKAHQANCDGTGQAKIGKSAGVGFGQGQGMGNGNGNKIGNGNGFGAGKGQCWNK